MSSPAPQRTIEDLETLHRIKQNLERLDEVRDNFLRESKKFQQEESFLSEIAIEKKDLEDEKMVLTEEMKAVNTDINKLDDAAKQSELEKKNSFERAKEYLNQLRQLQNAINSDRSELQQELLPENIVDPEEIAKFHCIPILPAHPWQMAVAADSIRQQHLAFQQMSADDIRRRNMDLASSIYNAAANANSHEASASNTVGGLVKQQPAPMKICNSCQQPIHRNAPICPLCKSKSRSRNPKRPKQRKSDDHP